MFLIVVLCYKFGYSLEYVVNLTIPQIKILESNLHKICKAEAGEKEDSVNEEANYSNRMAFGATVKMLKEKTGRENFTLQEIMNPSETLSLHSKRRTQG